MRTFMEAYDANKVGRIEVVSILKAVGDLFARDKQSLDEDFQQIQKIELVKLLVTTCGLEFTDTTVVDNKTYP